MDDWVIFGAGHYLSDIFDIVHANNGRVKSIIKNIEFSAEDLQYLHKRVQQLSYPISILAIHDFVPNSHEKYTFGFRQHRKTALSAIKKTLGITFSPLIHSQSNIGSHVVMGEGVIIGPGVVIAPNASLGDFCLINRLSSIGHDTVLESCCSIMPGVNIGGLTSIGEETTIGIGATVIDRITVGSQTVIGAGSVVVKNIPSKVIAMGVPAKISYDE